MSDPGTRAAMPLRFWKKEKPEKETEEEEPEEKPKPEPKEAPKAKVAPPEERAPKPKPEAKPVEAAPTKPAPSKPGDLAAVTGDVHAALVEMGLTVPATKAVFEKRIAVYPGGAAAFLADYRSQSYRAVTRVLADWLGFRVSEEFEPGSLLGDVNLRLSSFKLNAEMKDVTWLDKELGLRKGKLILGDLERVVRFKNARDLLKGVNDMIAPKRIAFLELETWADDYAFLIVREPRWEKLAETELVVVKADPTARGGECGECGAPVGKYWSDCLKCGAVFG